MQSLNNGIFLREYKYDSNLHQDEFSLYMALNDIKPDDLGIIDLWTQKQKTEAPLIKFASMGGKNIIDVQDPKGEWKWKVPIGHDLPYVVEDIDPTNNKKGYGKKSFQIKLNKQAFGHGDIITYDKFTGVQLVVTNDDILPIGDAFVYTVECHSGDYYTFLSNEFLKQGVQFFRIGSVREEYNERYSEVFTEGGFAEFYNYVGNAQAHVYKTISEEALRQLDAVQPTENNMVTEIWKFNDANIDPSITSLEGVVKAYGADYVKSGLKSGSILRNWVRNTEAAMISKLSSDNENYCMWGKGGMSTQDGVNKTRMSVGLWEQLNHSNIHEFNKKMFTLKKFKDSVYDFFNGKEEFNSPNPTRTVKFQTGMGGLSMINELIQKETGNIVLVANQMGIVSGGPMDLKYGQFYTRFVIPFLANIEFEINPAFDNVSRNDIENPIVDGYPLSSYSFIAFDVTEDTGDNIFLLRKAKDHDLKWRYVNGTCDYMGRKAGFQSSGNFSGCQVYMTQPYSAIWVKDPTKVMKIVMTNPKTGGHL